ncbi:Uma2 family endonuclease [Candidatus Poribacteria bacterium]|nr:Uma2 family endonuclease [Candidatus Poribacteria bacterium]MYF55474.1 Uma2 family endonuclease [Candidatus Poribacteria bacterium]MYI95243.1 Uma2 family endonuclease [Candidatus Poribacteria bacterium]
MATSAAQTILTPEEYIILERKAIPDAETVRNEYVKGKIIAMSGASRAHNLITMNISAMLHINLKGRGCETYANEMRVSTPSTSSYFYPDVVVVCEEPRFEDDVFDILLNPILLVEVLSPSTEVYDRGEKFRHYRELPSLQEYILVAQDKICIERFNRQENNWILTDFQNIEERLSLISVQCELPLHEIYDRVTFPDN